MKKNNAKESSQKLTDEEIKNIAKEQFKSLTENITEREKKFIVVGGQSGAGKSKLVKYKSEENKKQAVIINIDKLRRTHPSYKSFFEEYGQDIYYVLGEYTSRLVNEILQLSRKEEYSVIFEVAMRNEEGLEKHLNEFKKSGYNNEVDILAASKLKSDMTVFKRYCRQRKQGKSPRFVEPKEDSIEKVKETSMGIYKKPELYNKINIYLNIKKGCKNLIEIYSSEVDEKITPKEAIDFGVMVSDKINAKYFEKHYKKVYLDLLKNNDVEIYKKLKELKNGYFEKIRKIKEKKKKKSIKDENEMEIDI